MRKNRPVPGLAFLGGVLVLAASLAAQDRVKLTTGKFVTGDILAIVEGRVELVTPEAVLEVIPAELVAEVRRGEPFSARVRARLAEIDERNPQALFEVAKWAEEARGMRSESLRLLRRAVALRPDFPEARERLGHVLALGTWYPDARTAYTAVKDRMTADGYVYHKQGWIKKELLPYLKETPADWLLWQNFLWRSVTEIRKERGDLLWKKEWYVGEETRLVRTLKEIEALTGDDCHAAKAGPCEVYCYLGREEAQEAAERQLKARQWFVATFEVKQRRRMLETSPTKVDWVLSGDASFQKYLDHMRKRGMSQGQYNLSLRTGNYAAGFFYCGHLGREAWKWSLVSHMGLAMMRAFWVGGETPAWITVASGHHAELNVMGDVRVQWVHIGAYDQEVKIPELRGHSMKEIKEAVLSYYRDHEMPSLRAMMSKDMNELTQEIDTLGTVYLLFFLEEHKETWLDFLTQPAPKAQNVRERFEHHFKMTFEAMDLKFREWLGT